MAKYNRKDFDLISPMFGQILTICEKNKLDPGALLLCAVGFAETLKRARHVNRYSAEEWEEIIAEAEFFSNVSDKATREITGI